MSRTGEDIESRINVAIMDMIAVTAYPLPYSKVCDTVRPRVRECSTARADLGRETLIDFLIPRAMLNSLVREHRTEARPRRIQNGLGHLCPRQSRSVEIAHCDVVKLAHDAVREFVQEIPARIGDLGVKLGCQALLMSPLRLTQSLFESAIPTRILDFLSCREGGKLFQSQIDADAAIERSQGRVGKLDDNIQKPVTPPIAAEVCSVLDIARRERTGIEHAEAAARKPKSLVLTFEVTALQGHPSKRLSASIAQVWPTVLPPRLGILFTDCVDSAGMQSKFPGTSGGQDVQIKPAGPAFIPLKGVFLRVVAIVPYVVHRATLFVQQTAQGLHSIAVNKNHWINIQVNWVDIQAVVRALGQQCTSFHLKLP